METRDFEDRLAEITAKIYTLPTDQRDALLAKVEETRERHLAIRESTVRALSALDDWRIIQKYRIFDMEARLRESRDQMPPGA